MEMIVDLCLGSSWDDPPTFASAVQNRTSVPVVPDAHACRGAARLPRNTRVLNTSGVLQVGGLVYPLPALKTEEKSTPRHPPHFRGCLRNLRINGKVSLVYSVSLTHRGTSWNNNFI